MPSECDGGGGGGGIRGWGSTLGLGHGRVGVSLVRFLILSLLVRVNVGHLERQRRVAETQILRRDETGQEDIDAFAHREGHSHHTVDTGLACKFMQGRKKEKNEKLE